MRQIFRKEFQSDPSVQTDVFRLVNHSHAAGSELPNYAVVRDGSADRGAVGFSLVVVPLLLGEGLRGLLTVAEQLRADGGRLGTLLGHAGNRQDAEIEALARVAAQFHPQLVVVKENEAHLRGRTPGEIPRILHAALRAAGLPEAALPIRPSELEAVQCALAWARRGDVLALPVHSAAARAAVLELLGGGLAA